MPYGTACAPPVIDNLTGGACGPDHLPCGSVVRRLLVADAAMVRALGGDRRGSRTADARRRARTESHLSGHACGHHRGAPRAHLALAASTGLPPRRVVQ